MKGDLDGQWLFSTLTEDLELPTRCECECVCYEPATIANPDTYALLCQECALRIDLPRLDTVCSRMAARN